MERKKKKMKNEKKNTEEGLIWFGLLWFGMVQFYEISTIVGYLMQILFISILNIYELV